MCGPVGVAMAMRPATPARRSFSHSSWSSSVMSCTEMSFRLVPPPGHRPGRPAERSGSMVPTWRPVAPCPRHPACATVEAAGRPAGRTNDPSERSVTRMAGTTPDSGVPAGTVVVGVDGSTSADQALDWAIEQAALEHRPLTLVHALGPLGTSGTAWLDQAAVNRRDILDAMRREGHELLDRARQRALRRHPHLEVREVLRMVDPREALLELSQDATMVV